MNNLLSIGEVAKIRNVNVQSLRYYEKLGILIPAYTNPDSGYRYYSLEQLMILDTIILCIDIGIPLKNLKNYVDPEGQLEFERLLKDGKKIASDKIKKIESNITCIDRTLQHINSQKAFKGREGYYSRYIFERYVITIPCEQKMDAKVYENNLSKLFDIARAENLQGSFPHGIISTYHNGIYNGSAMFLEVLPSDSPAITMFPEGNYFCYQELREIHSDPYSVFSSQISTSEDVTVITSSMSPNTYKYDKVLLEFQVLIC